jgi:hypothetical protein
MKTTGLKRARTDKFYTKNQVADKCIEAVKQHLPSDNIFIIEPSAGNGAFVQQIKTLTNSFAFYDIEPDHEEVIKQDFLELDFRSLNMQQIICFIGNPPFGRQSSLAIQFIKKSSQVGDFICFILPSSFKKDSLKQHFPNNFHLIHEHDIEKDSFIVGGKSHDVPCVFQIWKKCKIIRDIPVKLTPMGYQFVKRDGNPDIAFRRVGVNAGNVYEEIQDKSEQSHYFIKFSSPIDVNTTVQTLNSISYPSNNTVGPKSISKQELIYEFNKLI